MKKRTLILSSLLGALALAVGVGAGVLNSSGVKGVEAASGDHNANLQLAGLAVGAGWSNAANTDYQLIEQADGTFVWTGSFSVERFRLIVGNGSSTWTTTLNWDNVVASSAKVADGTFDAATNHGSDGDKNIYCNTAGTYTLTVNAAVTQLSITAPAVTSYDVTEYAVVNRVKEATAIATEKAYEGVGFSATMISRVSSGLAMTGWYTDEACTAAFTQGTVLTAATTLYANYVTPTAKKTVYYSVTGWSNAYVYSFGGNSQFGSWPGTKITTVTNGATFNSIGAVYQVELYTEYGDDKIIFNNNSGTQTGDLTITDGALYVVGDVTGNYGDVEKGAAAKVVYDINIARNAVTASGSILATSICGISKATATSLLAEYDGLTTAQKAFVDASTDYTYNSSDTSKSVDSGFPAIIAQLRIIANAEASPSILVGVRENDASLAIIAFIATLGLTVGGVAIIVALKKKKHVN